MPPEPILIVALSGRALAASARRAGYAPIVLDAFDDLDTQACALASARVPIDERWNFDVGELLSTARRLAPPPMPLVWGSGFERSPALLEKLARSRILYGNNAATVSQIKDPFGLARRLAELGIAHPEVRRDTPEDPEGWLVKRVGGAGGGHIRPAAPGAPPGERRYYQRRVRGRAVSALVLGDGRRARTLSFSEQWADPAPDGQAFRFGGCAVPARLPYTGLSAHMARAAEAVVASYALRGVAGVDFLVDGEDAHLLEINPRPGASLDAYERAHGVSLFDRHVRACRGDLGEPLPAPRRAVASAIAYARGRLVVPYGMDWPVWAVDRGADGTVIPPGHPVCTVFGEGVDANEARQEALRRVKEILGQLERATATAHGAWTASREASANVPT